MKKSFISFLATLTLTPMALVAVLPTVSCSLKSIDARINGLPDSVEMKDIGAEWWNSHDLMFLMVIDIVTKLGLQANELMEQADIDEVPDSTIENPDTFSIEITIKALEGKGTASKKVTYIFTKKAS